MRALVPAAVAACFAASACAHQGLIDDGTSVSFGPSNAGVLLRPARMPTSGDGFVVPDRWARRGVQYGTDELVAVVVAAARRVSRLAPGSLLGVADLSPRRGGPSRWHHSHQTGRDVDLIYFTVDGHGEPLPPESMYRFDAGGNVVILAQTDEPPPDIHFDVARNWLLVKALMTSPVADVQWIFCADWLKQLMLDYALAHGEPGYLVLMASYLVAQPGDSLPHDDHMHVRVYCSPSDRVLGCSDRGSYRWLKRDAKYAWSPRSRYVIDVVRRFLHHQEVESLLSGAALPFPGLVPR